jgi:hypothetical protein
LEDVGDVDGGQGREGPQGGFGRGVMQGDTFDDRDRQAPQTKQVGADVGMGGAEYLLLRFTDGDVLRAC